MDLEPTWPHILAISPDWFVNHHHFMPRRNYINRLATDRTGWHPPRFSEKPEGDKVVILAPRPSFIYLDARWGTRRIDDWLPGKEPASGPVQERRRKAICCRRFRVSDWSVRREGSSVWPTSGRGGEVVHFSSSVTMDPPAQERPAKVFQRRRTADFN